MYKRQEFIVKLLLTVTLPLVGLEIYRWLVAKVIVADTQRALDQVNGPWQTMPLEHVFVYIYLPYLLVVAYVMLMAHFWYKHVKSWVVGK